MHAPVPCSASTEETTSINPNPNPNPIRLHDLYVLVTPAISHHHHVALEPLAIGAANVAIPARTDFDILQSAVWAPLAHLISTPARPA